MKRTTIFLDEGMERSLQAFAAFRQLSVAALVRSAIAEFLERNQPTSGPQLGFLAAGRSGRSDTAERHEELLWRAAVEGPSPPKKPRSGRR